MEPHPDIQSLFLQVCLVGKSRNYQLPDEAEAEQRRANYIESRKAASGVTVQRSDTRYDGGCCHGSKDTNRTSWGAGFQPRERLEMVRNCAALPRDFVDGVVLRVANVLLGMTEDGGGGATSPEWNRGGKLPDTKHSSQANKHKSLSGRERGPVFKNGSELCCSYNTWAKLALLATLAATFLCLSGPLKPISPCLIVTPNISHPLTHHAV